MKTNNKILIAAGALTLGLVTISCTEDQDWSTDSAYNRAFGVKDDISVDQYDTYADITFKTRTAGTYTIEIATDTLNDEIPEGTAGGSRLLQVQKAANIESKGNRINDLIGNTRYFLRIRCAADGKEVSKWVYFEDSKGYRSFKTKAEQIFNAVPATDIEEDGVRLTWDNTKQVSAISVYKGDERKDTVLLDNTAITAGEYTFSKTFGESGEAIKSSTTYKFYIWLNTSKRGELNVQTAAAMPAGDYKYQLPATTTIIDKELLEGYAATAATDGKTNYSVTIGIPAGTTIDFHGTSEGGNTNITIPDGMSVTFFGMPGGDAPTIKFQKNIDIAGTHTYIAFENVKVVDDGAGYFLNQSKACSISEFNVKDCEISGFGTSFFRFQGSDAKNINKVTLTNSIFHDMCSGYSFFHIDANKGAGGGVKNIAMDKCTLYNIATGGKMFIYSRDTDMESIFVKNTTFYNCIGNGNYWVDFDKNGKGCTGTYEFVNCLFTKTPDEATNKNVRGATNPVFDGCKKTNDFFKVFDGVDELDYDAAALFTDPANGNFMMKKDLSCGDPRWFKE